METGENHTDRGEYGERYSRVLSAGSLLGSRVRNAAGEELGKVEQLMIDTPTGQVAYAVISFGGFLGIGDKLFAVPWRALAHDERKHEFFLNLDRRQLEQAPGFNPDRWPDMADPSWGARVNDFFGLHEREPASY